MRVALAGYAYGRTLHAPLIEAAGGSIVAISTSAPERVAQARADRPEARVVPDLEGLLEAAPEVGADVVVLCTPTALHAEHAEAVIDAGLPCVVDKPLSVDAPSARRVVERAEAAEVPLTVFLNRRWDPAPLTLAALLREGALGAVHRFEMRYERWRPEPKHRWREQAGWQQGGGVLLDLGPHLIDPAVRTLGPISTVDADVRHLSTPADDDVVLHCRHASGGSSLLLASSLAPAPGPQLRAVGTRAGYLFDDGEEGLSFPDLRNAPDSIGWIVSGTERRPAPRIPGEAADFYRILFAALADDAASPRDRQAALPVDPWDAVHLAEVMDAARRSAQDQTTVRIEI